MTNDHRYLYKYLPCNEGTFRMITEGTLKFTKPTEFNDPFDYRPHIIDDSVRNHPFTLIETVYMYLNHADGIGNINLSDRNQWDSIVNEAVTFMDSQMKTGGLGEKSRLKNTGICCFSRTALNILMWSHYADNHKGIVAEFEFHDDSKWPLYRVNYSNKKPSISPYASDEEAYEAFLTKHSGWKYEAEERLIEITGHQTYPVDKTEKQIIRKYRENGTGVRLTNIILGLDISLADKTKIQSLTEKASTSPNRKIGIFSIKNKPEEFTLFVPDFPRDLYCDDLVMKAKNKG